jgi:2-hydroxychromene-2-carboxylate isomerase
VRELIKGWALDRTGLTPEQFEEGWENDDIDMETRFAFKYSAIRSVFGTPTFFLNEVVSVNEQARPPPVQRMS